MKRLTITQVNGIWHGEKWLDSGYVLKPALEKKEEEKEQK